MVAQYHFIGIGGPALQQLTYAAADPLDSSRICEPIDWSKMEQLKGLTKLEIRDYVYPDGDGPYLLKTGLVELVLVRCPHLEIQLFFRPGYFPHLEKLHIEDDCCPEELEAVQEGVLPLTPEEDSVGGIIFSLPKLRQVSGGCKVFSGKMKEGLLNWDRSLLKADDAHSAHPHHRNLWTRK